MKFLKSVIKAFLNGLWLVPQVMFFAFMLLVVLPFVLAADAIRAGQHRWIWFHNFWE